MTHTPGKQLAYHQLWPLALLICVQGGLFALALADKAPIPISPFSTFMAGLTLLVALALAMVHPAPDTQLFACIIVVMMSIVLAPFNLEDLRLPSEPVLYALPWYFIVRLFNLFLLLGMVVQWTAMFPARNPVLAEKNLSKRRLAGVYLGSFVLVSIIILLPRGPGRVIVGVSMIMWGVGLALQATRQHGWVVLDTHPAYQRSARQARLLLFGIWLAQLPLVIRVPLYTLGISLTPSDWVLITQPILPLTLLYAIRAHNLFEIDLAVRRTLAYGVVLTVLLSLYFTLTLLVTTYLPTSLANFRPLLVLVVMIVASLLFRPIYSFVQGATERVLYPERFQFGRGMAYVQERLGEVVGRDGVEALLNEALPTRVGARFGRLVLDGVVSNEALPRPGWEKLLVVNKEQIGHYQLGSRLNRIAYSASEQAQLTILLDQVALALAYSQTLDALNKLNGELEEEVQRQTAQVVTQQRTLAVVEERHRLARDLHDSVTQTLFSMQLSARAVRKLAIKDPAGATVGLNDLEVSAKLALNEMRDLLSQLRQPVRADSYLDLSSELRRISEKLPVKNRLSVELTVPPVCVLPAQIAQALLFIAQEALHNAAKHAAVTTASCTLLLLASSLQLRISDAGVGFDLVSLGRPDGHRMGLQSMRERVADLGGTVTIRSRPGAGTTIIIQIPLPDTETTGVNI